MRTLLIARARVAFILLLLIAGAAPSPSLTEPRHGHADFGGVSGLTAASLPAGFKNAPSGQPGSGDSSTLHRAGGREVAPTATRYRPAARLFYTGTLAGEPTLGVDEDGTIFFVGLEREPTFHFPVLKSSDGGITWDEISPLLQGHEAHPVSQDPFLWLDKETGRLFDSDFTGHCSLVSFTDDQGGSWDHGEVCGLTDHQTIFTGPPAVSPTVGYPNVVYYCAIDGGITAYFSAMAGCAKSLDGGRTWVRTGEPAFHDDPRLPDGQFGIPGNCGGATGHGFVDPVGTVYLPRGHCGQPWLAISDNEGATWRRVQVADTGIPEAPPIDPSWDPLSEERGIQEHEAAVVADGKGNIYYVWTGRNRLPYLAVSRDAGTSWSKPKMIGPPGLTEASLPTLDIGARGRIAIAYIGSVNAPGGDAPTGEGDDYTRTTWNGYVTVSANALSKSPLFFTTSINNPKDPLVIGECGILRCQQQYDFIDIVIGPDGTPWTSMVHGCRGGACSQLGLGIVGHVVGGPNLGRWTET
jgi:hypothetical protein